MNIRRSKFFIFLSLILFFSISFNISSVYGQSYLGDEDDVNVSEEGDSEEADSELEKSNLRYQVMPAPIMPVAVMSSTPSCGGNGQVCCGGNVGNPAYCNSGFYCGNNFRCSTTRPTCGFLNQPCCPDPGCFPRVGGGCPPQNCGPGQGLICRNGRCIR